MEKKNNVIIIALIVVILLLVGVIVYLGMNGAFDKKDNKPENTKVTETEKKDEIYGFVFLERSNTEFGEEKKLVELHTINDDYVIDSDDNLNMDTMTISDNVIYYKKYINADKYNIISYNITTREIKIMNDLSTLPGEALFSGDHYWDYEQTLYLNGSTIYEKNVCSKDSADYCLIESSILKYNDKTICEKDGKYGCHVKYSTDKENLYFEKNAEAPGKNYKYSIKEDKVTELNSSKEYGPNVYFIVGMKTYKLS